MKMCFLDYVYECLPYSAFGFYFQKVHYAYRWQVLIFAPNFIFLEGFENVIWSCIIILLLQSSVVNKFDQEKKLTTFMCSIQW